MGRRGTITDIMNPISDKKTWRNQYRAATQAMRSVWARELQAMSNEEALRIINSLNVIEPPWRRRPDWSGLVDQQAILHRWNK